MDFGDECSGSAGQRTGSTRFLELTARRVEVKTAEQTASSSHGPLRLNKGRAPKLGRANAYLSARSLPSLVR